MNRFKNVVVDSLRNVDYSGIKAPMGVVYKHPKDNPRACMVRIFAVNDGKAFPTNVSIIRATVEECRQDLMKSDFVILQTRDKNDAKCIVETWIRIGGK